MREGKAGTRIGVLMGGVSAEREVSLKTGGAVMNALRRRGYGPSEIDVGRDVARELRSRRTEVAFLALHGRGGEDGTIQGLLESMNIPYTGSGVLASAMAMNKKVSKWIFSTQRIPTAPFLSLRAAPPPSRNWPFRKVGLPAVVKPNCEGSTIGIGIVRKVKDLWLALEEAFKYDDEVLVEKYIHGRELTVGVLGGKALPVVEIVAAGGFYDYEAKYQSVTTDYLVPAPLPPPAARRLQRLALKAHNALGCRGGTRVDFRLDRQGRPFVLEVNTIPGMTDTSLLPKAAREAGIEFDELVERILTEALGN